MGLGLGAEAVAAARSSDGSVAEAAFPRLASTLNKAIATRLSGPAPQRLAALRACAAAPGGPAFLLSQPTPSVLLPSVAVEFHRAGCAGPVAAVRLHFFNEEAELREATGTASAGRIRP
jgi:hypothetical protein